MEEIFKETEGEQVEKKIDIFREEDKDSKEKMSDSTTDQESELN